MKTVKNKHPGFDIDDDDWVVKHGRGRKQRTLYQTSDGKFFLRYADEVEVEAISELEARQLVRAWEFIDELVSAFRTGTPPNIEKYLGLNQGSAVRANAAAPSRTSKENSDD